MGLKLPLRVAGCGPGDPALVTPATRAAAQEAQCLAGAPRLLALFPEAPGERLVLAGLEPFLQALDERVGRIRVTVLVSGDPGLASLAGTLRRRFGAAALRLLPGVSSVQLAFAAAGLDWLDARFIRAHAVLPPWDPTWTRHPGPLAILAGAEGAAGLAAELARARNGAVWRCERLGLPGQRVSRLQPAQLVREGCDPLSVLIVEGASV